MSLFSAVRGLWWVASEVVDAARQLVEFRPGQDDYRAHLADVLAEKEAGEEVTEPRERIVIPDGPPISMSEFTLGKLHKCSEESCCYQDDDRYEPNMYGTGGLVAHNVIVGPSPEDAEAQDDCGLGGSTQELFNAAWLTSCIKPEPLVTPLNADEVLAVRRLLESSAAPGVSPVEAADSGPGVTPPDPTPGPHPTSPAEAHKQALTPALNKDRGERRL